MAKTKKTEQKEKKLKSPPGRIYITQHDEGGEAVPYLLAAYSVEEALGDLEEGKDVVYTYGIVERSRVIIPKPILEKF
jgi:hypothetical protein